MALEKLRDVRGYEIAAADQDWLVRAKVDAHTSVTSELS
jgi:hypothetical protein